jgi:hypothetical protein
MGLYASAGCQHRHPTHHVSFPRKRRRGGPDCTIAAPTLQVSSPRKRGPNAPLAPEDGWVPACAGMTHCEGPGPVPDTPVPTAFSAPSTTCPASAETLSTPSRGRGRIASPSAAYRGALTRGRVDGAGGMAVALFRVQRSGRGALQAPSRPTVPKTPPRSCAGCLASSPISRRRPAHSVRGTGLSRGRANPEAAGPSEAQPWP